MDTRSSGHNRVAIGLIMQPTPPFKALSELYPEGSFRREDETNDGLFYAQPRLVVHVDDFATEAVASYFGRVLPQGGVILDLMSSWRSHIPQELPRKKLVGLGLNAIEMAENPALDQAVVYDINVDPKLPFDDGAFDAVVITVSIQYIVRPLEVFAHVNRTLKEAGSLHVVYSNRMFPTKAVAIWKALNDASRAQLIATYFQYSGGWEPARTIDIGSRQELYVDPVYVVTASKSRKHSTVSHSV